jgi:hypothetical protein
MSGTQTAGYDLVMEWAEDAYQRLLGAIFDADNFLLGTILGALGIPVDLGTPFSVTVSFDKPAGLPASATDVIDIHVLLGDTGALGSLRIVASVDVNTAATGFDIAQINLANKLWLTEISVVGFPLPGLNTLFANTLRQIKSIPLVPFPVNHAETSNVLMKNADVGIIDDTSPADKDASAFLITFGGGSPGNKTALTQSFVSPGGNAGVAVSMAWICRVISPMIDTSLNLGGAFTNCRLTRTVRIDDDNDVDLTGLTVTQQDGFLAVKATVSKSGFCYSASGTVGAKIKIAVENSRLVVKSEVDNPNVDVDIPWYCYVAGAVIGAVLGGLLPGVIYAVVGAVLVPLIMYLATEVIEGTINSVAEHIADALNELAPAVDIPAVGFDLIFSDAFIDDVQIVGQVRPRDTAVVRCSGTASVPSGAAFDLDSGMVGPRDMPSGDLLVAGGPLDRTVRSMCGARWTRTGLRDFAALYRAAVYPFSYTAPNPVPLAELATLNPFGLVFGDPFRETKRIYGVRTNEGRWAAVQAVEVTLDRIVFRYITWEKALATVQIVGGFDCPTKTFVTFGEVSKPGSAVFVRSPALGTVRATPATGVVSGQADPCASFREAVRAVAPVTPATLSSRVDPVAEAIRALPLIDQRIGTFVGDYALGRRPKARFDARTVGFGNGRKAAWQLNGTALSAPGGSVDLGGGTKAQYEITGTSVTITLTANTAIEMRLSVTVVDDAAHAASAQRCVRYDPRCTGRGRVTPVWVDYQKTFAKNFGVVEVAPPAPVIL